MYCSKIHLPNDSNLSGGSLVLHHEVLRQVGLQSNCTDHLPPSAVPRSVQLISLMNSCYLLVIEASELLSSTLGDSVSIVKMGCSGG
jgi:hypothetical protein